MNFCSVNSSNIRLQGTFEHIKSYTGSRAYHYISGQQCNKYLVNRNNEPENIWPSFYYRLETGSHSCTFGENYYFYDVYDTVKLWHLIATTMRSWWIEKVKKSVMIMMVHILL